MSHTSDGDLINDIHEPYKVILPKGSLGDTNLTQERNREGKRRKERRRRNGRK